MVIQRGACEVATQPQPRTEYRQVHFLFSRLPLSSITLVGTYASKTVQQFIEEIQKMENLNGQNYNSL